MEQPFDSIASTYDGRFTDTPLGRTLRSIVWSRLEERFHAGDRILELNCGTGEDALWMARRGMTVLATDSSSAMLAQASRKISTTGLQHSVSVCRLDLDQPRLSADAPPFDGVLSNFGGLNCVANLDPLWRFLRRVVKTEGIVVAVPMGRWCAWEMAWNLLRLDPRTAFRRLRPAGVLSVVGGSRVPVFYPSLGDWKKSAGSHFRLLRVTALGVFLPPSYLADHPATARLFPVLGRLESALAGRPPFRRLGDHLILEMARTGMQAESEPGSPPADRHQPGRGGKAVAL